MNLEEIIRRIVQTFRQQPERPLTGLQKLPADVHVTVFIERVVMSGSESTHIEGDVMNDHSHNHGPRIHGDLTIHGDVQNAFNTINQIDTGTGQGKTLQGLLTDLHREVTRLIDALPEGQRPKVARSLRTLTEEAASAQPDRRWFQLSAEGLIDAAKAVAAFTEPVTAAVKAVLAFLKIEP